MKSTLNTLSVEYRKVEALIPYARNPRTHSPGQIAKIAASIVEYGWTNPILVDGDNGIIAGHGRRLAAARKLGLAGGAGDRTGPPDRRAKAGLVIADNRLALDAGWDEEMLALELAVCPRRDTTCSDRLRGCRDRELLVRCRRIPGKPEPNRPDADADDVPEAPVGGGVRALGDVWRIGPHRLICGDATDRDVVAALMLGGRPACASPRHPTATSGTTPRAASPIGMA